jgi:hypothetical protein
MKPEGEPVLIDSKRLLCPAHGEHLREQWPKGIAVLGMQLVQAALAGDPLVRAIDPSWDGTGHAKFDTAAMNAITARRPLCYFVDRETLRAALLATGVLTYGRCDICGVPRESGPYQMRMPPDDHVVTRTVCVECALNGGERLHAAHPDGGVWTS